MEKAVVVAESCEVGVARAGMSFYRCYSTHEL
jgi:hypothetical protein